MKRLQLVTGLFITACSSLAQLAPPDTFQRLTSTAGSGASYDVGVAGVDGSFSIIKGVDPRLTIDASGNVTVVQGLTVKGPFNAAAFTGSTLTGGVSGLTLNAGGTNQNVVLTPTGSGYTLLNGNVGLGTAAPNARLRIDAAAAAVPVGGLLRLGAAGVDYSGQTNNVLLSVGPGVVNVDGPGVVGGRFKIDAAGQVGIGTPTPSAKLDVAGTAKMQGPVSITSVASSTSPGTGALVVTGGVGVGGSLNAAGDITANRLGVGVASPGAALHVGSNAHIVGDLTVDGMIHITSGQVVADTTSDTLHILTSTESTGYSDGAMTVAGGAGIAKNLNVGGSISAGGTISGVNMLVSGQPVWHSGNFNPNNYVQQSGGSVTGNLALSGSLSGGTSGLTIHAGAENQSLVLQADGTGRVEVRDILAITNGTGIQSLLLGNQDGTGAGNPSMIRGFNGHLQFGRGDSWIGGGGTFTSNVTFSSNGNVGIGNGNPANRLHVTVGANDAGITLDDGGGNFNAAVVLSRSGTQRLKLNTANNMGSISGLGNGLALGGSDGARHLVVATSGRVGVGSTAPNDSLEVGGGGLRVSGTGSEAGSANSINLGLLSNVPTLYSLNNSHLQFKAGGSVRQFISNGGNVGIGTSSPLSRLHVASAGNTELTLQSLDNSARRWGILSGGSSGADSGKFEIIDRTAGAIRLAVDSTGNVGVGTGTPGARLDVAGTANVASNLAVGGNATVTGQTSTGTLLVNLDATFGRDIFVSRSTGTGSLTVLQDATVLNAFFIPNGRAAVGMHGVTPATMEALPRLQVNGVGGLWVTGDGSAQAGSGFIHLADGFYDGNWGVRLLGRDNGSGHDLSILTRSAPLGAFRESMTVKPSGRVGIGNTAPDSTLTVNGNGALERGLHVNRSGTTEEALIVGSSTAANGGNIQLLSNAHRWNLSNESGVLSIYTRDAVGADRQEVAQFKPGGDFTVEGRVSAEQMSVSRAPLAATDAANKQYVDESTPFRWDRVRGDVTLRNPDDWVGLGVLEPEAPLHVGSSSHTGEVARFSPGGPLRDLNLRSFMRLDNQNPDYWWEFSVQDENGGGTYSAFALRAKHPNLPVSVPRLFVSPITPLVGTGTPRSFMRLYNMNPDSAWDLSLQDNAGTGADNSFAIREYIDRGVKEPAVYIQTRTNNVGIGTTAVDGYKLSVNGTIRAKEIVVETGWADYVFADDYVLQPLSEVEQHIKEQKRLPGVPSANEIAEKGANLGDMQSLMLAKIEELTLRMIEQEKRIQKLEAENASLRAQVR